MATNGDPRGMTRRASAASTNIPASVSVSSSTTRVHKPNESTHGFIGTHPTNPGPTYSPSSESRTPQGKIVLSLLERLKLKLPFYSGLSLTDIEEDPAVLMILESLIEISRHALDVIVWKIAKELEKLRQTELDSKRSSLDILQSEVFLLKVMAVTMAYRWQYRDRHDKRSHSSIGHANGHHVNGKASSSPAPPPSLNGTSKDSKKTHSVPTLHERLAAASPWLDAQPLNEALGRYLVLMLVMLLRQAAPRDDRTKAYSNISPDATLYTFESIDRDNGAEARDAIPGVSTLEGDAVYPSPTSSNGGSSRWPSKTPSLSSMSSGATSQLPLPRSLLAFKPTPRTLITSSVSLHALITEWASKIVYLLSAANWEQVRTRIRMKIHALAQNNGDDLQDPTELHLLQYCAMDRNRLSEMLNELSSLLVNMSRDAQALVGQTLHRAIWNWVDNFPGEFTDAVTGQRKLEIAERFFDILMGYSEESPRKATWPALNALMIISYERMAQAEKLLEAPWGIQLQKQSSKSQKKDVQFLEQLRKNIDGESKLTDVAMLCSVDMLRAASYVPPQFQDIPLHNLALELVIEFKNRLLKARDKRPFFESMEQVDVSLYADAIAVLAHFIPQEEFVQLLAACLEPERSDAVKLVAVEACIAIVKEAAKTPWQNITISDDIKTRIVRIFQSAVGRQNELDGYGVMRRSATKPVVKRYTSEAINDRELLILSILALHRMDPRTIMVEGLNDDYRNRLRDITLLIRHTNDPAIPLSTVRTLNSAADWILSLQSDDQYYQLGRTFLGTVVPIVLQASGSALLDARDNFEDQRTCTQLALSWVNYYGQCLDTEISAAWDFSSGRLPAMMVVEIAFLVTLTSADTIVSMFAARGLRDLAIAECQPNSRRTIEEPENAAKRYPMYEQLGDPAIVVVGRVAHQKRIRKLLRLMQNPCPLHAAVWHECYWRWCAIKDDVIHGSAPPSQNLSEIHYNAKPSGDLTMSEEEKFFQWQNLTWFLSSFGAISIIDECGCLALKDVMPIQYIPDRLRIMVDGDEMLQDFMSASMEALIANNAVARDTAKEALGSELNPRLYGRLFKHLKEVIDDIALTTNGNRLEAGEELLLVFFDQFLTVLKLLVDRPDAPSEDVLGNMDLNKTLLTMARLMDNFSQDSCYRLRMKFCGFCESALARTDAFGLRKDDVIRNNLLEVVVEWIEPNMSIVANNNTPALLQLRHDSDVAALRTMVKLLERLRLQPLDISAGDDATNAVSRRYLKYQQRFIEMLSSTAAGIAEEEERSHHSSEHLPSLNERRSDIRDVIINGLANLLSTNISIGLKHFMPLSDDEDLGKRAIFCKVVSRVMDLGGKIETNSYSAVVNRRTKIGELVKGSDMILVLAICETCPPGEVDIIIPVLLNLFDTRSSLLSLLKLLVDREVKTTQHESGLFRGNSMRMKLLCAFAKQHGYDYLRSLVKPFLEKLCQCTSDYSFILDPTRASEEELERNRTAVKFWTEAFLQLVRQSLNGVPLMLREISAHIAHSVRDRFPESRYAALGAFIFLRFISPALVSPETVDVELPQDSMTTRRGLLHITKIIQNLANNVRFGKEAHMVPFNDFLQPHVVDVMRFLQDLARQTNASSGEENDEWIGGNFDETDAIVLHRYFEKHADKVGKELLSLSKSSKEGEAAVIGGKKAWDTLCAALVEMGQPVELPKLSPLRSTVFEEYRDFMYRNADRNTESVQSIFGDIAVRKDESNLYLLSIWKLDVEVLDFELLIYHVFKTLMSAGHDDKNFEVIMDCTNYTTMSEVPMQWFKFFLETTPYDMRERFKILHILNCNQHMTKFLRKLYNICSGIFQIEVRSYLSVNDVSVALDVDIADALQEAWILEQEDREEYKNVMLRQAHLMKSTVNITVAQSHLRIDHVKAQLVYPSFTCKTTEIVPYADVGDVYNVSTGRDVHEFIVRRNRNGGTLYFSSPEREHIVKSIRSSKSRMNVSRTMFFDRFSRLSNVSALLLNIAMFNAFADSQDLRGAASDLLSSVCSSLKYDGELFLPSGGFIPGNPVTMVTQLSEKLAAFAPELTLDFISQVCVELVKTTALRKAICLRYMNPWVKNLNKFCDPTDKLYELSGARLRDCIKNLIEVTVQDRDAYDILQRYTWAEVGKLDTGVLNIIVDEMMRTGSDGGIGSDKCEIMAETLSSMCSARVRGKILAKLRKALGKTCTKPSKTLEKNAHWNEITSYARLALGSGLFSQQTAHCQLLVPEVIHLVTLLTSQGDATVRSTIYGLALQTFQSLYLANSEDSSRSPEIRGLLHELQQPEIIRLFGLEKMSSTSPIYTALKDGDDLGSLEELSRWFLRAIETCAGNSGLANIWRARWMGLLTATAFQLSPSVQPRAFIVMGTLASSDVDDDLLYQMLVALRNALRQSDEADTQCVVSMLHCVCKVVSTLAESSRYIGPLFWLAVALLESSHAPFFVEANKLLCACITTLNRHGAFKERGFVTTLLEARSHLEDISTQLDQMLGLSFDCDFSFSLAAIIFKGVRRPSFRASATETLRCLLKTVVSTLPAPQKKEEAGEGKGKDPINNDILGYVLALLPISTSPKPFKQLLQESGAGPGWTKKDTFGRTDIDDGQVPQVPFEALGCRDPTTALLIVSFIGSMLSTAQSDDAESQMLFGLLKDMSFHYPDTVSMAYDGLQEKIHDIFTSSSNPSILSSVSTIFRISMEDATRTASAKESTSTLSTLDEESAYGQRQKHALEELNMQGLPSTFQFLALNRGYVSKVLHWFPDLISKIID